MGMGQSLGSMVQGISGAAGVVLGAAGDMMSQAEQQEIAKQNDAELARSIGIEEKNATAVLRQGSLQSGLLQSRSSVLGSAQRVGYAAAGVDGSTGTAAAVQDASSIWGAYDASVAMNDARRAALGHKEVARRYGVQRQQAQRALEASRQAYVLRTIGRSVEAGGYAVQIGASAAGMGM